MSTDTPQSYKETINSHDEENWKYATSEELKYI